MKGISGLQFPYTIDYYIDISYLYKCGGIYFLFYDWLIYNSNNLVLYESFILP